MVELAASKFVCIVDDTKLVKGLGGSGGAPKAKLEVPGCIRNLLNVLSQCQTKSKPRANQIKPKISVCILQTPCRWR